MSVTMAITVDIHSSVAKESFLKTMYVAPIASASLASITMTVLQENLVVILITCVNQATAM